MKTRHFAALALMMGWYLLVPPTTRTWWVGPERYDNGASFSRWTIQQSYDKAGACESARLATPNESNAASIRMENSLCVASDDPRLSPMI